MISLRWHQISLGIAMVVSNFLMVRVAVAESPPDCSGPQMYAYLVDLENPASKSITACGAPGVTFLVRALEQNYRRNDVIQRLGEMGPAARSALPQLLPLLRDPDQSVRLQVIQALGEIGQGEPNVTAALTAILNDPDLLTRKPAAESIALIRSLIKVKFGAERLVQALQPGLGHPDPELRARSVELMGVIGPDAQRAVPQLLQALKDNNGLVRANAAEALGRIGPNAKQAVPQLLQALRDNNGLVRANATEALGRIGPAPQVMPFLVQRLKDSNGFVRANAAEALGRLGPIAKPTIPLLSELVEDQTDFVRDQARQTLRQFGPDSTIWLSQVLGKSQGRDWVLAAETLDPKSPNIQVAIPALLAGMQAQDPEVQRSAVETLCQIIPAVPSVIPDWLSRWERSPDREVRVGMLFTCLQNFENKDQSLTIPFLNRAIQDQDDFIRTAAFNFLRDNLSSNVQVRVAPLLMKMLQDADQDAQTSAAWILGQAMPVTPNLASTLMQEWQNYSDAIQLALLGGLFNSDVNSIPAEIITKLAAAIATTQDPEVRAATIQVLSRADNPQVPLITDVVIAGLTDSEPIVRAAALSVLVSLEQDSTQLRSILIQALQDPDPQVRQTAVSALASLNLDDTQLRSILIQALQNPDPQVRQAAVIELRYLQQAQVAQSTDLVPLLQDSSTAVQMEAALTLAEMRAAPKPYLPILIQALDSQGDYQRQAIVALGSLGPSARAAAPKLVEILGKSSAGSRSMVAAALFQIDAGRAWQQLKPAQRQEAVKPSPLQPSPPQSTVVVRTIQISGVTLLEPEELQAIAHPFEGKTVPLETLEKLADAITQRYTEQGYFTARAFLNREMINGVVLIQVMEGNVKPAEQVGSDPINPFQVKNPLPLVSAASLFEQLQSRTSDASFDQVREKQTEQFWGTTLSRKLATVDEIRDTLTEINRQTQTKSAILYINFIPGIPQRELDARGIPVAKDDDQLELLLVTGDGTPLRQRLVGVKRSQVLKVVQEFRMRVTDPRTRQDFLPPARQLYQWLIAPVEAQLQAQKIDTLLLSPDLGLQSLPYAALYDGQQFLVEKYATALIPSFSLLDPRYRDLRQAAVLAMGASVFSNQPPLPAVPVELNIITALWPGQAFLNTGFTIDNLNQQRQKQKYSIVHLAGHAEFRPGNPADSYIQFFDQRLQLDQIQRLNLQNPPVDLLVLSAGRTGLGSQDTEFGFAGLAMQAGVKSVLGALWYISDDGTLGLMSEFYTRLKIVPTRAQALRQAQIAMLSGKTYLDHGELRWSGGKVTLPGELATNLRRNLTHPYHWAGFTLVGNPW